MSNKPLYLTENSVFDSDTVILFDNLTYRELGRVEIIEHGNFQATISCGRKKGQRFQSSNKDVCEGWLASNFYHKRKRRRLI